MTEIEKVKAQIQVLQKKLSFLEELEKTKSPVEEAFKDWMGVYPPTNPSVDNIFDIRWRAFQMGYNAAQKDYKVGEYQETAQEEVKKLQEKDWEIKVETDYRTGKARHKTRIVDKDGNDYKSKPLTTEELLKPKWEPTPKTPEETEQSLKEAFREAVKQGVVSSSTKPQNLTDLIYDWWEDVFTTNSHWDMETCIANLIDQIELFLPKEQSAAGSQNAYVESAVEGFNDAIKQIKSKLR